MLMDPIFLGQAGELLSPGEAIHLWVTEEAKANLFPHPTSPPHKITPAEVK